MPSTVELPRQLSVSQLVELDRDPSELARRLRRPLPRQPAPWARRGTAFHPWLEQRWQRADAARRRRAARRGRRDGRRRRVRELRAAFERSEWAARTPAEVEVPFEMAVEGARSSGAGWTRCSADADDGWTVVDWKTGTPTERCGRRGRGGAAGRLPAGLGAAAAASPTTSCDRVRAAFHYVRSNETIGPADLLDAPGLAALITG